MISNLIFVPVSLLAMILFALPVYMITTRIFGAEFVHIMGVGVLVPLAAPAIMEEAGRYCAALITRVRPGLGVLLAGAAAGVMERIGYVFWGPERGHTDNVLLAFSSIALPVALHATNSALAARARVAGGWRTLVWLAPALIIHLLNNNSYIYGPLFGPQNYAITRVLFWIAAVALAILALRKESGLGRPISSPVT